MSITPGSANFDKIKNNNTEINNLKDYEDLQDDIYELCRWTTKWLLFFNANKCKVLHIGNNNPRLIMK